MSAASAEASAKTRPYARQSPANTQRTPSPSVVCVSTQDETPTDEITPTRGCSVAQSDSSRGNAHLDDACWLLAAVSGAAEALVGEDAQNDGADADEGGNEEVADCHEGVVEVVAR